MLFNTLAATLLHQAVCGTVSDNKPNIVELAQSVDDLSTLVAAVVAGDLVETLSSPGPFTVFAPTNEAFGALPEGTLDTLLKPENKDQLVDTLTYHVLPAQVLSTDLKPKQIVKTVEGKELLVSIHKGEVYANRAKVVGADNLASNGVAHIIDGVLLPPSALGDAKPNIVELAQSVDDLSTLVAAVVAGDLVETLSSPGPFTVFAPTNDAFGALPEGTLDTLLKPENKDQLVDILTYHVLPAQVLSTDLKPKQIVKTVEGKELLVSIHKGEVYANRAKVVGADNLASNGVAHIIDGVLLPPSSLGDAKPNIVELAQSVDDLSTLVSAVVAGDLVETLSSPGPFTVFAPTNEAFGALPEGTLDTLLKPENKDQLVDILTYHVLPAQVLSTDLKPKQIVKTVEGKELLVSIHKGEVYANRAKVVGADNLASNGVAHIINGVLLPFALGDSKPNIVELAQSVDDLSTLVAAVVAGDLVETLSSPGPFTVFAPTNEAFGALPEGTLDTLLKPENKDQLVDILTYHVLPAQVLSTDLKPKQIVKTVEGKDLLVSIYKGEVYANRAKVVGADNLASNGVAHIIDGVLLPKAEAMIV